MGWGWGWGWGDKFSYRFPLAFQLLRNDSATQISQSTLWRQHFGSGHVLKRHIIICMKGTNKSLLRVNLSLSVMLYYPSDLKSLSPTNAVNMCAMNVQNLNVQLNVQLKYEKPPVHFSPYPPPPYPSPSPDQRKVTLLSRATWLSAFRSVFC